MATKEEIDQNEQFLVLSPCFHLKEFSVLLPRRFQSRLLQICCMCERVMPVHEKVVQVNDCEQCRFSSYCPPAQSDHNLHMLT